MDGTISNLPRGYEPLAPGMTGFLLLGGGIDTLRIYFAGQSRRTSPDWGFLGEEESEMRVFVEYEERSPLVRAVEMLKENGWDRVFNANNPVRSGFVVRRA